MAGDFLSLTKPRVVTLLLLTTVCAMVIAGDAWPPLPLLMFTLAGGYLAAGAAGALNCYFDRDIDLQMARTRRRPIPAARLRPIQALGFGWLMALLAVGVLWRGANPAAALLAASGVVVYVGVYTVWLKRRSAQNIVIGGAAGAIPPLVGWVAVDGNLSPLALVLFAIIFMWTPPHFWALAVLRRDDYARASVPMLPVVAGVRAATRQILAYSGLLIGLTLLPAVLGGLGSLYLGAASVLGSVLLWQALRLHRVPGARSAWRLYRYSLVYLALLFVAMAVDRLLAG
jgi:protoheme IX farnesyltransferase